MCVACSAASSLAEAAECYSETYSPYQWRHEDYCTRMMTSEVSTPVTAGTRHLKDDTPIDSYE